MKSEERIQQDCYRWFHNTFREYRGLLFHVPNGGLRAGWEANRFKAMGTFPGVSDLIFLWQGSVYFIEMKNEVGKQSKNQQKWQDLVQQQGFKYFIIKDFDSFKELIELIMDSNKPKQIQ